MLFEVWDCSLGVERKTTRTVCGPTGEAASRWPNFCFMSTGLFRQIKNQFTPVDTCALVDVVGGKLN